MSKLSLDELKVKYTVSFPQLAELIAAKPVFWENPKLLPTKVALKNCSVGYKDVAEASARLERFRPLIARLFPETGESSGLIESPLKEIPNMLNALRQSESYPVYGKLLLKMDSHLPISGSIKARGGIYEVLKYAENLAMEHNLLHLNDDYAKLAEPAMRDFFSIFSLAVGSTGNLGLSIGIMGAALGFRVSVHMSADAREWKKAMLRSKGVTVVEYDSDYSEAVEKGRQEALQTPNCHFVDDENSRDLFLGYAVAGQRLKKQIEDMAVDVDQNHPLYVYLPCGVGGGPGGVAFGLKLAFGDAVHCYFAEPVQAPAMLLGLGTGLYEGISAADIGLNGTTQADGLAVGRPSGFVSRIMAELLDGSFTVDDDELFRLLAMLAREEGILLEPSALAGMPGPELVEAARANKKLPAGNVNNFDRTTHIVWATGGSMVPEEEWLGYEARGKILLNLV